MIFTAVRTTRPVSAFVSAAGPWWRCTLNTGSRRQLCNKAHEKASVPTQAQQHQFKPTGLRPTDMDKRFLVWSGRFKTKEQIPEFVSFEMIDASRNRMRIKACYIMIGLTIVACLVMAIMGKEAVHRQVSLTNLNMQKKEQWRQEVQQEQARPSTHAEKPQ